MFFSTLLLRTIKFLLFLAAVTPLIYTPQLMYPFIVGKAIFFRVIVELALILFSIIVLFELNKPSQERKLITHYSLLITQLFKNPIFLSLAAFFVSFVISTLFAIHPYRALWGNMERAEGLFGMFHFFIFLVLTIFIFNKKDWLRFIQWSVALAGIVTLYGLLQYAGIAKSSFFLPENITGISRFESFIGNATFFSSYLILAILLAVTVFFIDSEKKSRLKFYALLFVIALLISGIFISGTRGAIIGLGGGLLFFLLRLILGSKRLRKKSIIVLFLCVFFIAVFFTTRTYSVWQNVPGLGRLAKTDIQGDSVITRLLLWKASINAFFEKPFVGWGPENYLIVSNKYYEGQKGGYNWETWFDRAHNKYLDVLTAQGLLGLATYLVLLSSLFLFLYKNKNHRFGIVTTSIFAAYLIQNFFTFEDLNVYLLFFAFVGFSISQSKDIERLQITDYKLQIANFQPSVTSYWLPIIKTVIVIVIGMVGYSMYVYNYIPYQQSKIARTITSQGGNKQQIIGLLQKAFYPYNFFQAGIRAYVADDFYRNKQNVFTDTQLSELSALMEQSIDEQIALESRYDPRWYFRKGIILRLKASTDPKFYEDEEEILRKGIALSPYRQEMYYVLFLSLIDQKRFDKAVETMQSVIQMNKNASRPRYYLALAYAMAGEKEKLRSALSWFDDNDPFLKDVREEEEKQGMLSNYFVAGREDKIAEIVWYKMEFNEQWSIETNYYVIAFRYFIQTHDAQKAAIVARYLVDNKIIAVENSELFIEAIQKGEWEIIEENIVKENPQPKVKQQIEISPSKETLLSSLKEFISKHDKENVLKTAQELMKQFPETTSDMEVIIDLVNKGEWGILEKL